MVKSAKKKGLRASGAKPIDLTFKIDAYSPETFPMQKLGEYITKLGNLLGEQAYVHFSSLSKGSTNLHHVAQFEAYPKIKERLKSLGDGTASDSTVSTFQEINKMLKSDNASAVYLRGQQGAVILKFPGALERVDDDIVVRQSGSIMGTLLRVGGADQTAHVLLQVGEKRVRGIETNRQIASELGHNLYQTIRLHGEGRWRRDEFGNWEIEQFTVRSFEKVKSAKLSDALEEIKQTEVDWGNQSLDELLVMRGSEKH